MHKKVIEGKSVMFIYGGFVYGKMNMKKIIFNLFILFILLFESCVTFNHDDPYPNMNTVNYKNSAGYEFKNKNSEKLLIVLEGSGWTSVLGLKNSKWKTVGITSQLMQVLENEYTLFVPEKLHRQAGQDHFNDFDDRANYTYENLLAGYTEIINEYIAKNNFETIVIVGVSEGALMLPALYQKIDNTKVRLLVSYAYGGLSMREMAEIFATSPVMPKKLKTVYAGILDAYKSKPYPDSLERGFSPFPFRYWSSFMDIRPFNYYENINEAFLKLQFWESYLRKRNFFKALA